MSNTQEKSNAATWMSPPQQSALDAVNERWHGTSRRICLLDAPAGKLRPSKPGNPVRELVTAQVKVANPNRLTPGDQFGLWTLVEKSAGPMSRRKRWWTCRCACGAQKDVPETALLKGRAYSCGCRRAPKRRFGVGMKVGEWTLQHFIPSKAIEGSRYRTKGKWKCVCSCGTEREVIASCLGVTSSSCGHDLAASRWNLKNQR